MVKTVQSTKVHVFKVLAAIFDAIFNRKVFKQQHESDMLIIVIFRGNKCIFSINLGVKYLTVCMFSLCGGPLGRHLDFIKFPNDDKMSSVGYFKGKV